MKKPRKKTKAVKTIQVAAANAEAAPEQLLEELNAEALKLQLERRRILKLYLVLSHDGGESGVVLEHGTPNLLPWIETHADQRALPAGFIALEEVGPAKYIWHLNPSGFFNWAMPLLKRIQQDLHELFSPPEGE